MAHILDKVFGSYSDRQLKKIKPIVNKIEDLESSMQALSDEELRAKTDEFKERLSKGETLEDILPEAYAVVREASVRTLGLRHYPVQLMGGIVLHNGSIAEMRTGEGKANPVTTPIPTPEGWKTVGDIKVGDYLFDRLGQPTKVLGVYPQGVIDTYKITLKDGRTVECAEEHLWEVYDDYRTKKTKTMTTKELYDIGAKRKRGFNFHLPMNEAVQYEEKDLEVDPYVLGCFLGDGCKTKNERLTISSNDEEIVKSVAQLIKAKDVYKDPANYSWRFYANEDEKRILKSGDITSKYVDLLSNTYCYDKYIPEEYKIASEEQRWALIQGLMDTEGNIDDHMEILLNSKEVVRYGLSFSTTSPRLRDDFMEVCYSLGCSCTYYIHKSVERNGVNCDQYMVRINVPNDIKEKFFRLKRKKDIAIEAKNVVKRKDYSRIAIVDIEKLDKQTEQVCFEVDNDEHLFLIDKYVVTHNTLVATLPSYLNALTGEGVHIVTVNDYLAKRDSEEMGQIHEFLGLTVGCVLNDMKPVERQEAYNCDITYVTNNELGFDYLRDNMAIYKENLVQRGLKFAIIDEVDSILIDEARTPLIISGEGDKSTKLYDMCNMLVKNLEKGESSGDLSKLDAIMGEGIKETGDFIVNRKDKNVSLTEEGVKKVEKFFGIENLADPENIEIQHGVIVALKAHNLMFKDQDYVVDENNEIMIVDEFTGRIMPGRRYSDGLHQAIEAKEGVKVQEESKTLATITFQNLFNKYEKKSGMTGTALTEEKEFNDIYNLDVVVVPTNEPVIREDQNDAVYKTKEAKYRAVIEDIKESNKKGQPVLVGTITIETSELLSKMLKKAGIKHNVLNAKYHAQEAEIIADAGQHGAVTIATNMAGRGTDIKLDDEARAAGGLRIIGTERHESRRIDNQLRGRSGRQGDPGASKFYISLEDDLMKYFASEKLTSMFNALNIDENIAIEHKMLSKSVETAQKKIEGNNFGIRKNLLDYDKVMNKHREIIYDERRQVLDGDDMKEPIVKMFRAYIEKLVAIHAHNEYYEEWDLEGLNNELKLSFRMVVKEEEIKDFTSVKLVDYLFDKVVENYNKKEKEFLEPEHLREIERVVLLRNIDEKWMNHIDDMDHLKSGIGLQAYGQKDPVVEYQNIGNEMYDEMCEAIAEDTVKMLYNIKIEQKVERKEVAKVTGTNMDDSVKKEPVKRKSEKISRNAPCPCGSGKKYKHCCGK